MLNEIKIIEKLDKLDDGKLRKLIVLLESKNRLYKGISDDYDPVERIGELYFYFHGILVSIASTLMIENETFERMVVNMDSKKQFKESDKRHLAEILLGFNDFKDYIRDWWCENKCPIRSNCNPFNTFIMGVKISEKCKYPNSGLTVEDIVAWIDEEVL